MPLNYSTHEKDWIKPVTNNDEHMCVYITGGLAAFANSSARGGIENGGIGVSGGAVSTEAQGIARASCGG